MVVFGIGLIAAQQKVSGGYRFAMVLVGLVIVGASFQFVANSTYLAPVQERAATLQNTEEDISAVTRFALQEKALVIINAEPAVGIGLGNFRLTSLGNEAAERLPSRYWPVFARLTAHNSYLELLSEGGILGGAIIVGIVLVAIVTAIRAAVLFGRIDPSVSIVGLGVAASTVSLGTYLWLKGGLATTLAWVILGVWFGTEPALGISRLGNERRDEAPSP